MTSPHFSIEFSERRERLSNYSRFFLAIPHLLVLNAWGALDHAYTPTYTYFLTSGQHLARSQTVNLRRMSLFMSRMRNDCRMSSG